MIIDEASANEDVQSVLRTVRQTGASPPPPPPQPGVPRGPRDTINLSSDNQGPVTEMDAREGYQWDYMPLDTVLTDEQAQLCPAIIGCVSISSEHVFHCSVENLELVKWNKEAIEHLVLDEDKKDLLKGLVAQHSHRAKTREFGDLIENKGKGLVILLYGPPGVSINSKVSANGEIY